MVYSKLWCSKVTTMVRCQTYNLEMKKFTSKLSAIFAKENNSNLQDSRIPQFETTMLGKIPESMEVSLHDPNDTNCKNTAIWNEPCCFKLYVFGTALKLLNVYV